VAMSMVAMGSLYRTFFARTDIARKGRIRTGSAFGLSRHADLPLIPRAETCSRKPQGKLKHRCIIVLPTRRNRKP
jgi:hypothetical protein